MKHTLKLALLLVLATSVLAADGDQAALVAQLQRTEARFLKSIDGLSEAQWNYKPAPDRWSIAECAEHITASEPFIRGYAAESMKTALTAEMLPKARKDDQLLTMLVDRSKKF